MTLIWEVVTFMREGVESCLSLLLEYLKFVCHLISVEEAVARFVARPPCVALGLMSGVQGFV